MVEKFNLSTLLARTDFEAAIEEASKLEEDIKFFNLYMKRNKKSRARLDVDFSYYGISKFFKMVDSREYSTMKMQTTMMEYYVIKNLANQISTNNNFPYSIDEQKEIYNYFLKEYQMPLEDVIGEFIGCSSLSQKVIDYFESLMATMNERSDEA